MAILLDGPSTLEKGMILLTGAVFMALNPAIQGVGAFLSTFAEDRDIVQRLFFRSELFDFRLLDKIARHSDDIAVLKISGEISQASA